MWERIKDVIIKEIKIIKWKRDTDIMLILLKKIMNLFIHLRDHTVLKILNLIYNANY